MKLFVTFLLMLKDSVEGWAVGYNVVKYAKFGSNYDEGQIQLCQVGTYLN